MKKHHIHTITLGIALTLAMAACEEVINIDLNTAAPHLTVTAIVTDQAGPYFVKLSKTESFFTANNAFPAVRGASVTISDDAGNSDLLLESSPGIYLTSTLRGEGGRTYHLKIVAEGQSYEASSFLPYPVTLDSLASQKIAVTTREKDGKKYYVKCIFQDPAGNEDFYRVEQTIINPDSLAGAYRIYSDQVNDGQRIVYPVNRPTFNIGDTATFELYHINSANYDYYKTANNILRSTKGPSASASAPNANPLTNLSGGAVGYFGTYSVSRKSVVVR